jgi:hypothetical protein
MTSRARESDDESWGTGLQATPAAPINIAPQEFWVQLIVEKQLVDFLEKTGKNCLVLNSNLTSLSNITIARVVVKGQIQQQLILQPLEGKTFYTLKIVLFLS